MRNNEIICDPFLHHFSLFCITFHWFSMSFFHKFKFVPVANSILFSISYRFYLHSLGTSLKKWTLDRCHLRTVWNILLNDFEQVYNFFLENYCIRLLMFFVIFGVVFWLCLCSFRFIWLIILILYFYFIPCLFVWVSVHRTFVSPPFGRSNMYIMIH